MGIEQQDPMAELEAKREADRAAAAAAQQERLAKLQAGASEAGVVDSSDRYGHGEPETTEKQDGQQAA